MSEVLLIHRVHLGEMVHCGDENIDLRGKIPTSASNQKKNRASSPFENPFLFFGDWLAYFDGPVDVAAGVFEDVLDRFAAGFGLVGDAATNEVALGVGGDLARDPDLAGGFDGLGLRMVLEVVLRGKYIKSYSEEWCV